MGFFCGALVLLIVILIVFTVRHFRQLAVAVKNWGTPLTQLCDVVPGDPSCASLLSDPGIPPVGSVPYDAQSAQYAARIIGRFVAFIGTSDPQWSALSEMGPPTFITGKDPIPLAVVYVSGKQAVIAIRGTKTISNLISDLKFSETDVGRPNAALQMIVTESANGSSAVSVHAGMYAVYMSIKAAILSAVSDASSVFIAGHSMGAAVAFYAALDLSATKTVTVFGLAPPRAGDADFATLVASRTRACSLINTADLVPTLPWTFMPNTTAPTKPIGFAHVEPIAAFTARMPDIASCHALPAYFAGTSIASLVPQK